MAIDVTGGRIQRVLEAVLLPLARILLRCGVSYTEFSEIAKLAFVGAASTDYGVRKRPTNIARVAAMTGLSRKEVSRVRRERKKAKGLPHGTLPGAILNLWYTNPRYLDSSGVPKALSFAKGRSSFSALVRSVSSDIPPGALRHELIRAGAIQVVEQDLLAPTKRYFVPDALNDRVIIGLELGLTRLVETIAFNSDPANSGTARFQRFVEGPIARVADLRLAREGIQAMLANFSGNIDDYLTSFDRSKNKARGKGRLPKTVQTGVGLYYFEEDA